MKAKPAAVRIGADLKPANTPRNDVAERELAPRFVTAGRKSKV